MEVSSCSVGRGIATAEQFPRFDTLGAVAATPIRRHGSWRQRRHGPMRKGEVSAAKDCIGVVAVSSHGPIETLRRVAEDAARSGFASPLRYPASNPGSVAGDLIHPFLQGPTLNLLMEPRGQVSHWRCLSPNGGWIVGPLPTMAVAACIRAEDRPRMLVFLFGGDGALWLECDREAATNWLISIPETAERVS